MKKATAEKEVTAAMVKAEAQVKWGEKAIRLGLAAGGKPRRLYTSDAADDLPWRDRAGRRIIWLIHTTDALSEPCHVYLTCHS